MSGPQELRAVLFDVDGTLVDSERDGHRVAFNRAFEELGMPDRWQPEPYGDLLRITGGERRLRHHLEARGMGAEESDRLARRLHRRKTAIFQEIIASGALRARPGVDRLIAELEAAGVPLGVVTTGTGAWVTPLLDRLFGPGRFAVVISADEAPERKPAPGAYLVALERLDADPSAVVAVEDSRNGLVAATAAGLACAVVANGYTREQDFREAAVVLDGFGEPGTPAGILADPRGLIRSGMLDLDALRSALSG